MKPKFRSLIAAFAPLTRSSLIVVASLYAASPAHADQTWTGDAADGLWSSTGNWSGSALPGAGENAVFDGTSDTNLTIDTTASQSIGGIALSTPAGPVTINNNILTLGSGGVNMSAALQDLTLASAVTLGGTASQQWSVASGRTLTVSGVLAANANAAVNYDTSAGGTIKIASGTASAMLGRYSTINKSDLAALDASNNVVAGSTVIAYSQNPNTGAALPTLGNGSYDVLDVVNSNTSNPTAWRMGGTSINGGGMRFNTAHATGLDWSVDLSSGRNYAVTPGSAILVGTNVNTDVIWGGSGTIRTYGAGQHDLYLENFSAKNLIFNNGFSVSSGRTWRFTKTGTGKVIFGGAAAAVSGGISINQGTVQIGNGGTTGSIDGNGAYTIAPGATLDFNRTDAALSVGSIIGGSGVVNQIGTGSVTLTVANTYSGGTNITAGAIGASSLANFGTGDISINGGGVKLLADFDLPSANVIIGASGATFDTNGNNVTFSSPFASGSAGAVTKAGTGSLAIGADNDYTGGTTVNGGTLLVNAATSATGSGAVLVNTGAAIGGTGQAAGTVTVASGANLSPGDGGVGTLTVGGLDLNAGSTGSFEFNNGPANDFVAVTGPLTINGGAITLTDVTGSPLDFTTPGVYNLISHSSATLGTGYSSLTVANTQPGFTYDFFDTGTMITLTIGTTGVVSHWETDGDGSWADGVNWSTDPVFPNGNGETAIFDKLLSADSVVSLDGSKTVGAITLSSSPFGYTFIPGSGGSISLNNGANMATIANNVGTHVIAVDLDLASDTLLSSGSSAESLTLDGIISGGGSLTKPGPGTLTLSNTNTFTGLLTLTGGTTHFASGGLGDGDLTIAGATLIWDSGNTQDISNRTVTFDTAPVTFDTNGNDVSLLTSSIGNGGSANLTKAGLGKLTIGQDALFTGDVTISDGVLQLGTGGSTGILFGNIINNGQLDVNFADGATLFNVISGTGSFNHSGSGSLVLDAANTFSGPTTIPSGTGVLALANSLGIQNSTLQYLTGFGSLDVGSLAAVTLGGLEGDKDLVLENNAPAPLALTVGGNNSNNYYYGILSGGGSLTKMGDGVLTLANAMTYTGATTVSAGDLMVDYGGSLNNAALTVNGTGRLVVSGGDFHAATNAFAVSSRGFDMTDGTATFDTAIFATGSSGSSDSALIKVEGGVLTAPSIALGRTGTGLVTEPVLDKNLYITNGQVNIAGDLFVGTYSNQPNSTVQARVDGGSLTVGGAISVGLNNTGRWSFLSVSGGDLISTGTAVDSGVVLGGPWAGQSAFYVSSGTATVERIQFGQGAVGVNGLVRITGGTLYLGSGGITVGTTAPLTTEIRLAGGILAAKDDWSTSLPVNLAGPSTIQTIDATFAPHDITLNGAVTGTGSLSKSGDGTLTLTGGNSYTGDTEISGGTLSVTTKSFSDAAGILIYPSSGGTLNLNYSGGDRVQTLTIDGSPMADGIYGSLTNTTPGIIQDAAITGNGLLYVNTVVPLSPYESWASNAGLTFANDGPTQDPDNDGIPNELEFVLGGNPLASDTSILPTLDASGSNFIFNFNRADDSVGEIGLVFQSGPDLSTWPDEIAIPEMTSGSVTVIDGSPNDAITVTIPKGANTTLFGRLKAVK